MMIFKSILKLLWEYKDGVSILKSIYLNFKLFPRKQAVYLPLFVYKKTKLNVYDGGSISLKPTLFTSGMLKIGCQKSILWGHTPYQPTLINITGSWVVKGATMINNGAMMDIRGRLETGHDVSIGPNSKVECTTQIMIGRRVRISWECQLFDTDFHYSIKNNIIRNNKKPIHIGDYCWIGNRVSIMKGTFLPDYSVVASNSIVNKNFSECGERSLFSGSPAVYKLSGIQRLWAAPNLDSDFDTFFKENAVKSVEYSDDRIAGMVNRLLDVKDGNFGI